MKCANHPETDAEALCAVCQAPICRDCGFNLNGKFYCCRCLEAGVAGVRGVNNRRGAFSVLALSLLPGAGYMYLGLMNRGLQAMVLFFGSIFLASVVNLGALIGLVVPVLVFYSIFDSLQLASRMNEGLFIEDRPYIDIGNPNWQNILGYILIGLGALALLYNILPYTIIPGWIVSRLIPPLIIIAIGAYLLYRSLGRSVSGAISAKGEDGNDSTGQN